MIARVGIAIAGMLAIVVGCGELVNPNQRPATAPKASLELGLSPGAWIQDLPHDELELDLDEMVEFGVTRVRLDFDWSRIEQTRGDFDWSSTDRIVEGANSRGMMIHALVTYTPTWARPAGSSDKHPPIEMADFVEFVRVAAHRYDSDEVGSWEIWNEPNVAQFWQSETGPDPAHYAELLAAAANSIRSIDPDAVVVSGGLAPARDRAGRTLSPETFLETMYDHMPLGILDGVSIHPYSFPALPSDSSKDWNLFGRLPSIRDLVNERESKELPLWLTEFGAPTGSGDAAVSDATQGRIVAESLRCVSQFEWAGPLFLYNLRDRPGGSLDWTEDNFGLLTDDRTQKASGAAVLQFQQHPIGETIDSPCAGW